ncbi:MAG TPA: hypothetical protein VGZ73_19105 [Bryobacteraceae bacterium]|jgi:hypothetical protein|nr:hypothetical protein [Bryobacteraceae bacterium]
MLNWLKRFVAQSPPLNAKALITRAYANPRFAPRMPEVDESADIAQVFTQQRWSITQYLTNKPAPPGQRLCIIGIVPPNRKLEHSLMAMPLPDPAPEGFEARARQALPGARSLNITAISYTGEKRGPDDHRQLPFLSALGQFAYIGHSVVIFEGHPSGFVASLRGADVLIVDSGMLPFLQPDWFEVAQSVFRDKGRVRVFDRETAQLRPAVPSKTPPGWKYATEPDGETWYANCLLTTLGKRPPIAVELCTGKPLPDLHRLAIDPDELEWTSELPFQYDILSAAEVIEAIVRGPERTWPWERQRIVEAVVLQGQEGEKPREVPVKFQFLLTEDPDQSRRLRIERLT